MHVLVLGCMSINALWLSHDMAVLAGGTAGAHCNSSGQGCRLTGLLVGDCSLFCLEAAFSCFAGLATAAAAAVELGALPKKLEMSLCFMAGDHPMLITRNP